MILTGLFSDAQDTGWKQPWDGDDLTACQVGPGKFVVKDGLLKSEGGMGLLWYTPEKFGNCVIRVEYKTQKKEVLNRRFARRLHVTGVLYSLTKAMAKPGKMGEWNTMDITPDGPRTIVVLKGVKVTDFTEGQAVPPKVKSCEPDRDPRPGYIGLQNHSGSDTMFFREVAVRPLH